MRKKNTSHIFHIRGGKFCFFCWISVEQGISDWRNGIWILICIHSTVSNASAIRSKFGNFSPCVDNPLISKTQERETCAELQPHVTWNMAVYSWYKSKSHQLSSNFGDFSIFFLPYPFTAACLPSHGQQAAVVRLAAAAAAWRPCASQKNGA